MPEPVYMDPSLCCADLVRAALSAVRIFLHAGAGLSKYAFLGVPWLPRQHVSIQAVCHVAVNPLTQNGIGADDALMRILIVIL